MLKLGELLPQLTLGHQVPIYTAGAGASFLLKEVKITAIMWPHWELNLRPSEVARLGIAQASSHFALSSAAQSNKSCGLTVVRWWINSCYVASTIVPLTICQLCQCFLTYQPAKSEQKWVFPRGCPSDCGTSNGKRWNHVIYGSSIVWNTEKRSTCVVSTADSALDVCCNDRNLNCWKTAI